MKCTANFIFIMTMFLSASLGCSPSSNKQDEESNPTAVVTQVEEGPQPDRLLPGVNVPEIELLTPTEGVGVKPKFEWKAVDGATSYSLMLFDADGKTYWAWMGKSSYIYLGSSLTAPPEDSAGPILQPDMRWAVAAYDAQNHLLATSQFRPISP